MIRDRNYLDWLRHQRCILTGRSGSDDETVDPVHIGTAGKSIKSSDDEVLPVLHTYHAIGHQHGEITMFRTCLPDAILRRALRALARELYQEYLRERT